MCYFITVALPETDAAELAREFRGEFVPLHNPSLAKQLPAGHKMLSLVEGMCSCSIYMPSSPHTDPTKRREKYKKKGWSQAKIERAIREAEQSRQSPGKSLPRYLQEIAQFVPEFWVHVHWFSGDISEEQIPLAPHMLLRGEGFLGEVAVPQDTLVHVQRARLRSNEPHR
jgi:hypothetical protein